MRSLLQAIDLFGVIRAVLRRILLGRGLIYLLSFLVILTMVPLLAVQGVLHKTVDPQLRAVSFALTDFKKPTPQLRHRLTQVLGQNRKVFIYADAFTAMAHYDLAQSLQKDLIRSQSDLQFLITGAPSQEFLLDLLFVLQPCPVDSIGNCVEPRWSLIERSSAQGQITKHADRWAEQFPWVQLFLTGVYAKDIHLVMEAIRLSQRPALLMDLQQQINQPFSLQLAQILLKMSQIEGVRHPVLFSDFHSSLFALQDAKSLQADQATHVVSLTQFTHWVDVRLVGAQQKVIQALDLCHWASEGGSVYQYGSCFQLQFRRLVQGDRQQEDRRQRNTSPLNSPSLAL